MSAPAAKLGDRVVGLDLHHVLVPSPAGPVLTPTPLPFTGRLVDGLSRSVSIDNLPAALKESAALAYPPHESGAGAFHKAPANRAVIAAGSTTVFIDNKGVARAGDTAITCNDPVDAPNGVLLADGSVFVRG